MTSHGLPVRGTLQSSLERAQSVLEARLVVLSAIESGLVLQVVPLISLHAWLKAHVSEVQFLLVGLEALKGRIGGSLAGEGLVRGVEFVAVNHYSGDVFLERGLEVNYGTKTSAI